MIENKDIEKYITDHTSPQDDLLYNLTRTTHLREMQPRMLSGHVQGTLLELLSKMINPLRILEIGTFTGYSAICLARGLAPNGMLHTIEIDDELQETSSHYITKSDVAQKIITHIGNALDIIPTLNDTFDIVFIDGDKREYPQYYKAVINKVRKGGYIIADNVLWSGKVVEKIDDNDKYTLGVVEFNRIVATDKRVENLLLPIRDGLMIARVL